MYCIVDVFNGRIDVIDVLLRSLMFTMVLLMVIMVFIYVFKGVLLMLSMVFIEVFNEFIDVF